MNNTINNMSLYSIVSMPGKVTRLPTGCFGDPFSAPNDDAAIRIIKSAIWKDLDKIDLSAYRLYKLGSWSPFVDPEKDHPLDQLPFCELVKSCDELFSDAELASIGKLKKEEKQKDEQEQVQVLGEESDSVLQSGEQDPD